MFNLQLLIFLSIFLSNLTYECVLANDTVKHQILQYHEKFKFKKEFYIRQGINEELCELQHNLTENTITFFDATAKIPSGILVGNMNHFGQYKQCISSEETVDGVYIRGKYCMMIIRLHVEENEVLTADITRVGTGGMSMSGLFGTCVPNACPAPDINITFQPGMKIWGEEMYCREYNDKPFAVQDIIAIIVFSVLGLLVIVCSSLEISRKIVFCKDTPKLLKSFSLYQNINKLTRISNTVNPLSCINGIRVLSMAWVVIGHTYSSQAMITVENPLDMLEWISTYHATWITAAPLSVDTFFYLAGFLLTWSVLKKFNTSVLFLKSVPLLYLNRYLRLTPLLAAAILLQVSYLNHVSDGPDWRVVTDSMNNCLEGWWSNLLYIQNYVRPTNFCLPHSWYLAIDMQLYVVSPIVIFFLLCGTKRAVAALTIAICTALGLALGYAFYYNFGVRLALGENIDVFTQRFHNNTLPRSPPFVWGILVAYLSSVLKKKEVKITSKIYKCAHWIITAAFLFLPFHGTYSTLNYEMSQHTINFFNAWHRSSWVLGVGGIIFACMHGFGGPVQWFLSLKMWIIPARLSYAVYLMHYPIMYSIAGSNMSPIRFADSIFLYRTVADLGIGFFAGFVAYLIVEAPFAELSGLLFAKISGKNKEKENINTIKDTCPSPSSAEVITEKENNVHYHHCKEENLTESPDLNEKK